MDKEKVVVILLLITIILSIGAIVFTFSLNFDLPRGQSQPNQIPSNSGNVGLMVLETPQEELS